MKNIALYGIALLFTITLSSCFDYKPFVECTIDGEKVLVEETVQAGYMNNGTYTSSTVFANGENAEIKIQVKGNYPAIYTCTPDGSTAVIEIYRNSKLYTTAASGGTGSIELIQAGTNLIEGYFTGTLMYGNEALVVTEGSFSGRAY